jgi:hypothetical protein
VCSGQFYLHVWKSASSGVEATNRANKDIRQKIAVDILNATLILLKKKSTRYYKQQDLAWNHARALIPKGMELMEEAFNSVNVQEIKDDLTKKKMSILQLSARSQLVIGSIV